MSGRGRGGSRRGAREVFEREFAAFSVAMSGRTGIDEGDKIILPNSACEELARMEIDYPMLFQIENEELGRKSHCGVLEFSAEEGRCFMPFAMMQSMLLEEGAIVKVKNVALKKANYLKFRAQSVDFLDIANHRAVLEHALRMYSCATTGDMICLPYAGQKYYLEVTDVKPDGAASLIETNVSVDFDAPVGYVEPTRSSAANAAGGKEGGGGDSTDSNAGTAFPARPVQRARTIPTAEEVAQAGVFTAFTGSPHRIDGKPSKHITAAGNSAETKEDPRTAALKAAQARADAAAAETQQKNAAASALPARQSRLGDKFSVKGKKASAFSGAGRAINE